MAIRSIVRHQTGKEAHNGTHAANPVVAVVVCVTSATVFFRTFAFRCEDTRFLVPGLFQQVFEPLIGLGRPSPVKWDAAKIAVAGT